MKRLSNQVLGCVFCAWLALFWLAFWLGAPVPAVVGNRRLAEFPASSVPPFTSAWLQKVSAWAVDHSPFRLQTLVVRNRVMLETARAVQPLPASPGSSELCMGRDGWLFMLDEAPDNVSQRDQRKMVENALKIARAVTASGRRFLLMPIPDRCTVYPENAGVLLRWTHPDSIWDEGRSLMGQGFENAPQVRDCYLPLGPAYKEARRKSSEQLYWEHDTHWNPAGMMVTLPLLLERLQPGVWDPLAVHERGVFERNGELMQSFLLQPITMKGKTVELEKPASPPVETVRIPGYAFGTITRWKSGDPRSIKGRTLVITDSFMDGAAPFFTPWFEDVTYAHFGCTGSQELADRISQCDTLVFTTVERFLRWRMSVWGAHRYEYLTKALANHPAPEK